MSDCLDSLGAVLTPQPPSCLNMPFPRTPPKRFEAPGLQFNSQGHTVVVFLQQIRIPVSPSGALLSLWAVQCIQRKANKYFIYLMVMGRQLRKMNSDRGARRSEVLGSNREIDNS